MQHTFLLLRETCHRHFKVNSNCRLAGSCRAVSFMDSCVIAVCYEFIMCYIDTWLYMRQTVPPQRGAWIIEANHRLYAVCTFQRSAKVL